MFWLHFTLVWKKMRCRFVLVPICLDTELSFSMGAEMSWSRTVLLPSSPDYDILISTLEAESQVLIDWFKDNKMQANPDKFQIAVALLANKKPNLFFLPQFKCFYWQPLFELILVSKEFASDSRSMFFVFLGFFL